MEKLSRALAVALAVLAVPIAAGCGGGDDGDEGDGARAGGEVTIAQSAQPDSLDPAMSFSGNAWEALWLVYTPLLSYRHAEGEDGSELVPGLAESLPEISDDGLTYTLTLREGLEYSDGTPVRAGDFEHTLKRVLNLDSPGASFYEGIEGATGYMEADDPDGDIAGVEADDRSREITITLTEPDVSFQNLLAMTFVGLVPGDTPFRNLTRNPPPGVGSYAIVESEPNRQFVLERNERFPGFDGIPQARIDRITTQIMPSAVRQTRAVIDGRLDYMQDPPPADLMAEVREKYPDRYREFATNSTYFLFLNQRVEPFDDRRVREAVAMGLNRRALARIYAGGLEPGCSFLPPGMPGYDEALDTTGCPWGDPADPPDVGAARALIEEAGATGAQVKVWGNDVSPTDDVTAAIADQLTQIGLDAQPEIVDGAVYYQTIGNQANEAQAGFVSLFMDFPHPLSFFAIVEGSAISERGNQNLSNVDDPEINEEIAELREETDVEEVADRWGALDRRLVEEAHLAPYGHSRLTTFMSGRMNFDECALVHPVYQNDYSSWCLKADEG